MDNFIRILRDASSPEELEDLKVNLFRENVRIRTDRTELDEMKDQLDKEQFLLDEQRRKIEIEREQLYQETKQLKRELQNERNRLQEDTIFFDKKQAVLERAFKQLDVERRKFEHDRNVYLEERRSVPFGTYAIEYRQGVFFKGVTNSLALKKRYKDLLKIFHPDNLCGDNETLILINKEYEMLKKDLNY